MLSFAYMGTRVLSSVSLMAWLLSVAVSKEHHPLNFWLVVVFGLLFITALLWGWEARRKGQGSNGQPIEDAGQRALRTKRGTLQAKRSRIHGIDSTDTHVDLDDTDVE